MTRVAIAAERGAIYYVEAAVFGDWAAHRCHCCDMTWAVTHVPSGRRVHSEVQIDESTALRVASALAADIQVGALPVILPSDRNPEIPAELVMRINAVFYGALESPVGRLTGVAQTPGSDHGVARGAR